MSLQDMELMLSLICFIIYPLEIYSLYCLIKYDLNKEKFLYALKGLIVPIGLILIPTASTTYSQITNFIRMINPYVLILIIMLYVVVVIKLIYIKTKKNK